MSVTDEEPRVATALRWWQDQERVAHLWHGVFKGGGAKGVAYGGALEAAEAHGVWFRAVAGSSAGALTATLIAAGLQPAQIREATPTVLGKVRSNRLGLILGGATPLYSMTGVTGWLRGTLREQVALLGGPRADAQAEVTFAELFAATEIELHVVVMDLATGSPVVLSHHTTPQCEVAAAVAASCAIPVGFDSGRLIMRGEGDRLAVHRVVDGGAWANYPQFVFKDASFREYVHLPRLSEDAVVVGFVLDRGRHDDLLAPWGFRYDLETEELEDSGLFVRSGVARFVLTRLDKTRWRLLSLVLWPLLMIAVTGWWLVADHGQWEPVRQSLSSWLPLGWTLLAGTFAISVMVLGALAGAAYLFGRELIRVGIGTLVAALGVSTDVPPWLGTASDDWVVRVPVPPNISTRSFTIKPRDLETVVTTAHEAAARQIADILAGRPTSEPPERRVASRPEDLDVRPKTYALVTREAFLAWLCWIAVATGVFGSAVLEPLVDGTPVASSAVVTLLVVCAVPLIGIVGYARGGKKRRYVRAEEARRAAARAAAASPPAPGDSPPTAATYRRRAATRALCAIVVLALTGGLLREEIPDLKGDTVPATILRRTDVTSRTFVYEARIEDGAGAGNTYRFDSHEKVSLGERVRLRWVRLPQGLDFASAAPAGLLWTAGLGGSIAAMFIFGVVWALGDLRRYQDAQPPRGTGAAATA